MAKLTLRQTTQKLLGQPSKSSKPSDPDGLELPSPATIQELEELATTKLAEITRKYAAGEAGWTG